MLVLGDKYTFCEFELKKLTKRFDNIDFIEYSNEKETRTGLESLLSNKHYHYIILNSKESIDAKMIKYLTKLQFRQNHKTKIISIELFLETFLQKCYIPDDDRDLNFLSDIRAYNAFELFLKRAIDYFGGSVLFLIHFFMKFYVKKRIDEESPGEIYFVQKRVGLNNKEFGCIKYRSMILDAEKNGVQFAKSNDDRVFKFGNFMRKTRIDEIPQCINVLKGEMHLIGPRPERRHWINIFEKEIPYYNERHLVRPGITGWAQVNYPYGENAYDAKQKLMYDLYYIKHWSLWLEIKTIFNTVAIMVGQKGV
ncbi:sugar transferase [Campylobacter mucosalis]|uniref:sugar transferase n=1 Tax=Campylobacter mucosalis TaxID=202 RepID=UPI0004D5BA0F|nr:sugar transferase [Campylobacter mucosalis]KEA45554.1 sugar transferase [Campylobacter mucosalis]